MDEKKNTDKKGKQNRYLSDFISKIKRIDWHKYTDWHRYVAWFKSVDWRRYLNYHTYVDWFKSIDWRGNWCRTRDKVNTGLEILQGTGKTLVFAVVCALILMFVTGIAAFFMVVKGQEKVMVPDVTGKELTEALLEMQVKELYPKIQLRYTDVSGDAGKILEQSPGAGTIVKAGRRITLVVSRGVVIDHVENYVGMTLDDVKIKLQTLFAGLSVPQIVLADPVYKSDAAPAGTILAQDPPSGTGITKPVKVQLVVSRGPEFEKTDIPDLVGKSVADVLKIMSSAKIVFDFTQHTAVENETPGTVVSQRPLGGSEQVPNYTRVAADFAMPAAGTGDIVYGIFTDTLTEYPYSVPVKLEEIKQDGTSTVIISFNHPGGNLSIPYSATKGSALVLTVVDRIRKRITIQ